jgi:drug/metabolite transporter (DMT)-like permease
MLWLAIIISAHALYAIVYTADKFVVEKSITHPTVYAFLINIMGMGAIILWPFDLKMLSGAEIIFALMAGVTFALGTAFLFHALHISSASRVPPLVGSTTAIFTLIIGYFFFNVQLTAGILAALILLIVGIFLIAVSHNHSNSHNKLPIYILLTSILFALSTLSFEQIFATNSFIPGFIFTRIFGGLTALAFLMNDNVRRDIKIELKRVRSKLQKIAPFIKLLGAVANTLNAYAISLVGATIVNALVGLQYIFLIPVSYFINKKMPKIYKEEFKDKHQLFILSLSVICTAVGLVLLALNT